MVGDLAPHEAFPIGGTNRVRGYDEGAVGSGRSYVVASGEVSFPMVSETCTSAWQSVGSQCLRAGRLRRISSVSG